MQSVMATGTTSALNNAATNFVNASGPGNAGTSETAVRLRAGSSFKVTRVYVVLSAAPGAGTSWTVTLRRNGADTTITGSIAGAATSCDLSGAEFFKDQDIINLSIAPVGAPTAATVRVFVVVSAPSAFPLLGGFNTGTTSAYYAGIAGGLGGGTGEATEAAAQQIVPIPGWLRYVRVVLSAAPGGTASWVATLYKNGVSTGLTATITGAATSAQIAGSVHFAAGDTMSLGLVPSGGPASSRPAVGSEFVPDVDGESFIVYGSSQAPSTASKTYQGTGQGSSVWNTTEANRSFPLPSGFTIKSLYASLGTAAGAAKSWDAIFRNAGADSVSLNLPNTLTGSVTGLSVSPADKALCAFSLNPNSTPAAMTGGARISVALTGPTTPAVPGLLVAV